MDLSEETQLYADIFGMQSANVYIDIKELIVAGYGFGGTSALEFAA